MTRGGASGGVSKARGRSGSPRNLLRGLVEGVQKQGEKAAIKLERDRDVKVTKLIEEDDIEAYTSPPSRG